MAVKTIHPKTGLLSGPIKHSHLPELNAATSALVVASVAVVMALWPNTAAFAAIPPQVETILTLVSSAVKVLGVGLAVWGVVKIGTALSNGSGATGNELSEGIGRIAGGVLIYAAAEVFTRVTEGIQF